MIRLAHRVHVTEAYRYLACKTKRECLRGNDYQSEFMQLRGALRGAARPASLAALSKSLDLVAMGSSGRLVQSTVDELLADGSVSGSVKAGTFIPSIFAKAQQQAVQDFYAQNGFIE